MNKLLISFFVLALLALTACSNSSNKVQSGNNIQSGNDVQSNNIQGTDVQSGNDVQNNDVQGTDVQKISDIQKAENVNKTFTVQGKVVNTLKSTRFNISGYKIQDSTGTIDVSSQRLPGINTTVTVTGVLVQTRFFGLVLEETS